MRTTTTTVKMKSVVQQDRRRVPMDLCSLPSRRPKAPIKRYLAHVLNFGRLLPLVRQSVATRVYSVDQRRDLYLHRVYCRNTIFILSVLKRVLSSSSVQAHGPMALDSVFPQNIHADSCRRCTNKSKQTIHSRSTES